ncbi:MAG TPA: hypothetical protein GXX30_08205 [Firmicutes bacterium]|nr:hypothetical protein [Candidatus Fermentithermobacillaceae bacterium]
MSEDATTGRLLSRAGNRIARILQIGTILRYLGTPVQRVLDKSGETHRFLTVQGIRIMKEDGWEEASAFFQGHLDVLIKGNYWADTLWKNATHHYNPKTKRGLWIWPAAHDQCRSWFNAALNFWKKGKIQKALFFLGSSLHTVQDSCQPYHTNCILLDGHQRYESWVDKHKAEFAEKAGGLYNLSDSPEGWVVQNAIFSHGFIRNLRNGEGFYAEPTKELLARAQKTTAGFLIFFLTKAAETGSLKGFENQPDFFEKVLRCRKSVNFSQY